jgi:hypothetical protein
LFEKGKRILFRWETLHLTWHSVRRVYGVHGFKRFRFSLPDFEPEQKANDEAAYEWQDRNNAHDP